MSFRLELYILWTGLRKQKRITANYITIDYLYQRRKGEEGMNIQRLSELMIKYGVVLRAIPEKERHILEKYHADGKKGEIRYLEEYKREMWIYEKTPSFAGKFLMRFEEGSGNIIHFTKEDVFDSLEDALVQLESYDKIRNSFRPE